MYLCAYSTIQLCCYDSFFVLAGNSFLCFVRTQCTIQLCGCVSFWLWWEIVLKMRTRFYKNILLGYFLWFASRCMFFIKPNTLLRCISLFCMFLLYCTDPQVEVQIRILLNDKYRKSCQNAILSQKR